MPLTLLNNLISTINSELIVLKGFPTSMIEKIGENYPVLDSYIYNDGKINLDKINANQLLQAILAASERSILCCESLIKLCSNINNLSILGKTITIIENNLQSHYPNPTNSEIPDYDSTEFEDSYTTDNAYAAYYSYAVKEDNITLIQYIDNYSESNSCINNIPLVTPLEFEIHPSGESEAQEKLTSFKLDNILQSYITGRCIPLASEYLVENDIDKSKVEILIGLGAILNREIKIYNQIATSIVTPRADLLTILEEVWGYSSFRNIQVYEDLTRNRNIIEISQGEVIETVVSECEKAISQKTELQVNNILLTAPTGAGKSILFQLSAIYLAKRYKCLTLVISPLVALMDDQVDGLSGYPGAATLNSNISASQKADIISQVQAGDIDILYLSPELLLSYSITHFIGDRKLGLMVIDEAHTVTTWGRDFRVDYLFLGDYIRRTRKQLKYKFPVFALTATAVWDPTGKNDMVFETIRSLNMDPCIKFIGNVKRTNIKFSFKESGITINYEQKRRDLTIKRIREALATNKKTIVYFPFKKTVSDIIFSDDTKDIRDKIASYHAALFQNLKAQNALDFKNGVKSVMCATKAYGMGIDISDIEEVYHHAPTGNLSDYIQEIGRIARDTSITGVARIDFSPNDFRYIRKLHGLSTLKQYQLKEVIKKLMEIFKLNNEKRNLLISAADFSYIFPKSDTDNLDQNLKSALLLISNDLLNKLGFHSIIIRPKSLFSKCYVNIPQEELREFKKSYLYNFVTKESNNIFLLHADQLWQKHYPNISFPQFKFKLAEGKIFQDFHASMKIKVSVTLNNTKAQTMSLLNEFFELSHNFISYMENKHHRIGFSEMKNQLPKSWDSEQRERFLETFKAVYATPNASKLKTAYCSIHTQTSKSGDNQFFQFLQAGYENEKFKYLTAFNQFITGQDITEYCDPDSSLTTICELLNSLGVATYQKSGGEEPMIFVRINNPAYLNALIRKRNYENDILTHICEKQAYSERIFTYFFTTPMTDEERWEFIESYFLGVPEEKLLK